MTGLEVNNERVDGATTHFDDISTDIVTRAHHTTILIQFISYDAQKIARAAFFKPEIRTCPYRCLLPAISNLLMHRLTPIIDHFLSSSAEASISHYIYLEIFIICTRSLFAASTPYLNLRQQVQIGLIEG